VNGPPILAARAAGERPPVPGEVAFHQHRTMSMGMPQISSPRPPPLIHQRLDQQRPGDIRRRAEDEHRPRAEDIEGGPGDRELMKSATSHASTPSTSHAEMKCCRLPSMECPPAKMHAADAVLMQRAHQIADRLMLQVDLIHHLQVHQLLRREGVPELVHVALVPARMIGSRSPRASPAACRRARVMRSRASSATWQMRRRSASPPAGHRELQKVRAGGDE
jgi:hypothetical protein